MFYLLMFFSLTSFADTITPTTDVPAGISAVTSKQLLLLGRGIEDRKTHNWIQLACVGTSSTPDGLPSCNVLKFVFFKIGTDEAYYFGDPILIIPKDNLNASPKEIKKSIKQFYFNFHRNSDNLGHSIVTFMTSPNYAIVMVASMFVAPMLPVGVLLGIWMGLFGTVLIDEVSSSAMILTHSGNYTRASFHSLSEEGTIKTVRHKKFNQLLKYQSAQILQE